MDHYYHCGVPSEDGIAAANAHTLAHHRLRTGEQLD